MGHAYNVMQCGDCMSRSPDDLFAASVREMSHQMGALAKKNKLKHQSTQRDHESLPPNASPTQGDTESHSKTPSTPSPPPTQPQEPTIPDVPPTEPTPSPPPPLPPSPSPPEVAHVRTPPRTPVSRAETPLQTTLLRALQAKDLGSTGFVTGNELSATLTELKGKTVSRVDEYSYTCQCMVQPYFQAVLVQPWT